MDLLGGVFHPSWAVLGGIQTVMIAVGLFQHSLNPETSRPRPKV
jgi:hypothetical protein